MPRPAKKRRVCYLPKTLKFQPAKEDSCTFCKSEQNKNANDVIYLSVDEYEVIRLIDYKGLNQEEAAMLMGVARTTIQAIYSESRKKISQMLVESKPLEIKGGNFKLSFGKENCKHKHCHFFTDKFLNNNIGMVNEMEIIIPVNDNTKETKIAENLGRANFYLIYDLEKETYNFIDNDAKGRANGTGIQAAQTLVDTGARILLTPRCGMKAGKVLDAAGFEIYKTVSNDLLENINKYKNKELSILEERSMGHHGGN